ncbi:Iron-hydroxamate transporter permease subunit OS=Streptomyces fumanus OX=67302 GN=GCM10018772_18630 PE=3 SV=1 [Streptomyces fumanus]
MVGVAVAAVLIGDSKLLLGDVANWAQGRAGRAVSFVLDTRVPRVLAALCAGAALALAGTLVQAVTRNPLADPSVLGVSGGAALGAVLLGTTAPVAAGWSIAGAAFAGAGVAVLVVFGLAARGGFQQNRLVRRHRGRLRGHARCCPRRHQPAQHSGLLSDQCDATKVLTWLFGEPAGSNCRAVPLLPGRGPGIGW